jgi:hypothetical protein
VNTPAGPPPLLSPPAPAVRSGLATAAMICGILAIPTCFVTALPALVLGHLAWSQASRSLPADPNRRAAMIGLIFGYGSLVSIPVLAAVAGLAAPLVIRQRQVADQAELMSNMRHIGLALTEFQFRHGTPEQPFPADLEELAEREISADTERRLSVREAHAGDWLYFPHADPKDPNATLLISPPIGRYVGVLTVDIAVRRKSLDEASEIVDASPIPPQRIPAPFSKP